jgi:allantoinase
MADFDVVIRGSRVVTRAGEVPRCIGVRDGMVVAIEPMEAQLEGLQTVDLADDEVLLPGLVDTHVHVNEPGRTEWEGYATATRAAAAGGVTTIIDMPLNSIPPTCTVEALEIKQKAARGQCHVDVGFWGGVIPSNLGSLEQLHEAGVLGFKCFLANSGSEDFPPLNARQMHDALAILRDLGSVLLVHAESAEAMAAIGEAHGPSYAGYLATRPRGVENLAVAEIIEAARASRGHAHIVHLSSSDALPMIASARRDGVRLTAETCPHYLALTAEEIGDGATVFKCSPPVREAANRELLWDGLRAEILDFIASDHSPCTAAMKELGGGDFGAAWGGISSLQLGLPIVWTEAQRRGVPLSQVAGWMARAPAEFAGLPAKGRIAPGLDADFCIFAPDESFVVDPKRLHHRHPVTPYAGRNLRGVVRSTILRGEVVDGKRPRGQLLARHAAWGKNAADPPSGR